jgi:hypothetical protein
MSWNVIFRLSVATESSGTRRLVVKDLLNLLHKLGGQLFEQLQSAEVILQLLNLGSTKDDSRNVGVLCCPCQTELGNGTTKLLSNGGELLDLF